MSTKTRIKIAKPQLGTQHGTWAYKTVSARFSNTATRIFSENELTSEANRRLQALIDDIPLAPIRYIDDKNAPDFEAWKNYTEPYLGQDWHQPPWFFTEHYFYRRILEATGYFKRGSGFGEDPFSFQKRNGLSVSLNAIQSLTGRVENWIHIKSEFGKVIENLIYLDLWGNQADLSLWPAEGLEKPDHVDLSKALKFILVNDVNGTVEYLLEKVPLPRVDFIIDNAGFELVSDLVFADYLLTCNLVSVVRLHLKEHPTFVSDATKKDVQDAINFMREADHKETQIVGGRLYDALGRGDLQLSPNWFWTSPLDGWKMPILLVQELGKSSLVISKGDANYRRLIGDRHWRYTTPFDAILSYFPAPLLALRTLKSELVVGLKKGQDETVSLEDPDWLVDGRWGLIQFYDPARLD